MNACVIFSAESMRRINAYLSCGTKGPFADIEVCDQQGDVDTEFSLCESDARMLGETLLVIADRIAAIEAGDDE